MEADFIPAVCPNCGGKLEVDPSVDTLTCQFCGTEHLIRREAGGEITLEAHARCPLCKRNDRVEKVSAILHREVKKSNGYIPQQRVYRDSQGHTYTRTENVAVQSVEASDLARRLAPPPPPRTKPRGGSSTAVFTAGIILFFLGTCCIVSSIILWISTSDSTTSLIGLLLGIVPALLGMLVIVLGYFQRKKDQERIQVEQTSLNIGYQNWQRARVRWEQLYYCGRDDVVFIPGEKTSSSVVKMNSYIYSKPG